MKSFDSLVLFSLLVSSATGQTTFCTRGPEEISGPFDPGSPAPPGRSRCGNPRIPLSTRIAPPVPYIVTGNGTQTGEITSGKIPIINIDTYE
jgi:hypothetical protein